MRAAPGDERRGYTVHNTKEPADAVVDVDPNA
jgi:hypothetical protein